MSSPERDVLHFAKQLAGPQPRMHSPAFSSRGSSYAPPSGHVRSAESDNARKILELQNSVILLRTELASNTTSSQLPIVGGLPSVPRLAHPVLTAGGGVTINANRNLPTVSVPPSVPRLAHPVSTAGGGVDY